MTALFIDGIELTQTVAAELLALAPDIPADMSTDDTLTAINGVLAAHGGDLAACVSDLAFEYGDHPGETVARMSRATVFAARLLEVSV